jgi:SAM-dependent methyltransferase
MTSAQAERRLAIFDHTFAWLKQALPVPVDPAWRLLEVGAGLRGFASLYAEHVEHVIGLDLVDYSTRNPGIEYVTADLTGEVPIASQSIDIAVSHSVLEHVDGLVAAIANIDRVVKVGGFVYLTVAPLYYSAQGAHMRAMDVEQWEHLNPSEAFHLTDNPLPDHPDGGHFLNKMQWSDVLAAVGGMPWEIVTTKVMIDDQPIPDWLTELDEYAEMQIRCRGFFLLARKLRHFDR